MKLTKAQRDMLKTLADTLGACIVIVGSLNVWLMVNGNRQKRLSSDVYRLLVADKFIESGSDISVWQISAAGLAALKEADDE